MAWQSVIKKSKRTVDALTVETGDAAFWDRKLSGFGVRVYTTGRKVYVVQTRVSTGNLRRVTIDHAEAGSCSSLQHAPSSSVRPDLLARGRS